MKCTTTSDLKDYTLKQAKDTFTSMFQHHGQQHQHFFTIVFFCGLLFQQHGQSQTGNFCPVLQNRGQRQQESFALRFRTADSGNRKLLACVSAPRTAATENFYGNFQNRRTATSGYFYLCVSAPWTEATGNFYPEFQHHGQQQQETDHNPSGNITHSALEPCFE